MNRILLTLIIAICSSMQAQKPDTILVYQNDVSLLTRHEFEAVANQIAPYLAFTRAYSHKKELVIESAVELMGWLKLMKTYITQNNIVPTPVSQCMATILEEESKKFNLTCFSSQQFHEVTMIVIHIARQLHNQLPPAIYNTPEISSKTMQAYQELVDQYENKATIPAYEEIEWLFQLTEIAMRNPAIEQMIINHFKKLHEELQQKYQVRVNKELVKALYLNPNL